MQSIAAVAVATELRTFTAHEVELKEGSGALRAHVISPILVHVGAGQRCRAVDEESPATLPSMSTRDVRAGALYRHYTLVQKAHSAWPRPNRPVVVDVAVSQIC